MRLRALDYDDMESINKWRNESKVGLRTNGPETLGKQDEFYEMIQNRNDMRFWAVEEKKENGSGYPDYLTLIGQGGFTPINWENQNAEISLIIDPEQRGKGYGEKAVDLLLEQAFDYMGLHTVYGEVYSCNIEGMAFWEKMIKKYKADMRVLPARKYWKGSYWESLYFTFWDFEYTIVAKPEDKNGKV